MAKTIFEELEFEGINVPMDKRFYPYFCVYDFESYCEKLPDSHSAPIDWGSLNRQTKSCLPNEEFNSKPPDGAPSTVSMHWRHICTRYFKSGLGGVLRATDDLDLSSAIMDMAVRTHRSIPCYCLLSLH